MNKKMTIGVSSALPFLNAAAFADYRACGIGAIELSVAAEDFLSLDIPKIAREAREAGIDCWSFHLPFYLLRGTVIALLDKEERDFSVRFQSENIKRAADAGFRYAVVHPSDEPITPEEREAYLAVSRESIATLSAVAKESGITLVVENLPRTCLGNTSRELLSLLEGAPDARICFDTNHLLTEESHEEFIRTVADRLVTIHLSDYDKRDERHWLPGEGCTDFSALLRTLDEVGYAGPLMYEINRDANYTIAREHSITTAEIKQNADELLGEFPLTTRGTPLV